MSKNIYVDSIMGEWTYDKKKSTKENMYYIRRATVTLHKDNAVVYTDPDDFKDYKVYGEVTLTEVKLVNVQTSNPNYFRGVELLPGTKKDLIIK